ncbi:MAG: ABC transporter [Prevotella sp.]|jgi:ABC-type sugar transport system ATPase subunit|nr:ABC transporter [Prevotella sp.]MCI1731129.1 ABC transporter [Prevotella sp.]
MLEIKNGILSGVEYPATSADINFSVDAGEMLCIYRTQDDYVTAIIRSMLGLQPLKSGFITVDGDVVDASSAAYFRNMFSYVPHDLDMPLDKITDVLSSPFETDKRITKKILKGELDRFGIDAAVLDSDYNKLPKYVTQLILIIVAVLSDRPYLIIDKLYSEITANILMPYLNDYATEGHSVIIVSDDEDIRRICNKSLILDFNV